MFNAYRNLRKNGVIGINERNIRFVNAQNPRNRMKLVDDKIETKRLADAASIPNPELYGVIANARDMRSLPALTDRPDGFVVKPAQGSQGKGILVIESPLAGGFRMMSGRRIEMDFVRFYINNILSGMYSLGGQIDKAMIEYRVKFDDAFGKISFKGVPDIRVIVYRGIPVFAMLRLPTAASDGKANLHRGGVGVGVDIGSGTTMRAMQHDTLIERHPDTANELTGIKVPYWDDILLMAARSFDVTGLGYLGVDVVLDRARGPLLLELNGRPGISIQIANRRGMRFVMDAAMKAARDADDAGERVAKAREIARAACGDDAPAKLEPRPEAGAPAAPEKAAQPDDGSDALI